MTLVDLQTLKDRLRIDDEESSTDLARIGEEATALVVDFIKRPAHGWTSATVPPAVRAAVLLVAQAIDAGEPEPLTKGVKDILLRHRDPALR